MGRDDNEAAFFDFSTSETVAGTGEIILLTESLGGNGSRIRSFGGAVGTMGAGQTVRGVGVISAELINNGTIIAEPRIGTVLALTSGGNPKTNNNVIQADTGATLRIVSTSVTQSTGGQILANGGTVQLATGSVVRGGRFESAAGGIFQTDNSANIGDLTNNAPVNILNGDVLNVGGSSLTNNNTISINSTGGNGITRLVVFDDVAIDGTGEIVLSESGIAAQLVVNDGFTLTNAAGHAIRGKGQIIGNGQGANSGQTINNGRMEGVSAAEAAGNPQHTSSRAAAC